MRQIKLGRKKPPHKTKHDDWEEMTLCNGRNDSMNGSLCLSGWTHIILIHVWNQYSFTD